ncbi:hypothetical protein CHS0354_040236 [Potamilus streckersoni]|uniref:Proline-rich protein PRCC n=1 Tax=Potamilus streckersoni TaxID=2493646 RepID=A0AAE0S523_9BIVA|nr:hypothetical protein CHS0354_040236 [Potamilus streckersoni]
MSLVAYDASDESESEELTENSPLTTDKRQVVENHRAETKDVSSFKQDLISTSPISDSDSDSEERKESRDAAAESASSLLLGLPKPKRPEHIEKLAVEEDELEDEVKPKASQMADVPKPPSKKVHQPVKITIPALPTGDSDEETDEPVKKKLKPSSTKCGLTDLLPMPVHAAKKEANRVLLPYSLTKKQQPQENTLKMASVIVSKTSSSAAKSTMSAPMKALVTATYNSDSDEEDGKHDKNVGSSNFFSLDSDERVQQSLASFAHISTPLSSASEHRWTDNSDVPTVPLPPSFCTRTPINLPAPKTNMLSSAMDDSDIPTPPVKQPDADAPLNFNASFSQRSGHISANYRPLSNYADMEVSGQEDTEVYNSGTNDQYESLLMTDTLDPAQLMQDEEFLKLQGKKTRGKEEINIVDVNADDFVASTEELTKSLTEETDHRSQKNKDLPSSQQRRKHQITYLAFQAKERELELKNQWALNRQTKRQTQSKYGF